MADASIPVDLLNPGQVFACLGFLEFANELLGGAEAAFDWRDRERCRFRLRTPGTENPFVVAVSFLTHAKAHALAPRNSPNSTAKWDVPTTELPDDAPFPFPDPLSPATLPTVLEAPLGSGGPIAQVVLNHWGDETKRDNVKFWAGAGGYPGAARARDALALIRDRHEAAGDPFAESAIQSSSFSFDWRRDYIPLEIGFSLNRHHDRIATLGYPFVELLAALGLTHARPRRVDALEYRYSVIGSSDPEAFYPPNLIRAVLGGGSLPFPLRSFRMRLGWPGKEGQARAITTVTEEEFR